ncbi:uncharacterized protein CC84DRAFT_620464 [Paraphaeosphaeria sporulosa]|uniref:Uncharacterized protein n=1 Tax=Paraphaeosphaeria sporulosa TaxID=1460663 RepID=A0A177CGQ4_9PLEO|nr:uncharacterized protein CC84DRAFT_620464 [Paraphaeosphaeria sporulosa]OAG06754.1 hypothetical protein CC84DRAFT_620464 [Paraphaeosphaeria sporulosa]
MLLRHTMTEAGRREATSSAALGTAQVHLLNACFVCTAMRLVRPWDTRLAPAWMPQQDLQVETSQVTKLSRAKPGHKASISRSPFRKMQSGECNAACSRASGRMTSQARAWFTRETKRQLRVPLGRSPGIVCKCHPRRRAISYVVASSRASLGSRKALRVHCAVQFATLSAARSGQTRKGHPSSWV